MRRLLTLLALCCPLFFSTVLAQVKTNFNNQEFLPSTGRFARVVPAVTIEIAAPEAKEWLEADQADAQSGLKPLRIARPVAVDIDVVKSASWVTEGNMAYGKLTLQAPRAVSLSVNFDQFHLPDETEMYVYNERGNMITGPVTKTENNARGAWGSWVYKGEYVTIEIRTPVESKEAVRLHLSNVAYGFKEIYRTKTAGFGQSGACNVNVLCPEGNGWEAERHSVAHVLNGNGTSFFSGAMVMSASCTNRPYLLTADHCLTGSPDVANWRFSFQAWSATCTPSQNSDGITFNGATLRAHWAPSDFCLVELAQEPPAWSNVHYAGWTRSAVPALNGTAIHHPRGDVMKFSRANNPLVRTGWSGAGTDHWQANWNLGVTEPGSSGSPLFNQDHRIVGQLHGGPSACTATQLWDFYGSFDVSWDGGGTPATRLRDWLDPANSGAMETNTTSRANMAAVITGEKYICGSSSNYSINAPAGSVVTWSHTNPAVATLSGTSPVTVTKTTDGITTLVAQVTEACGASYTVEKLLVLGPPTSSFYGNLTTGSETLLALTYCNNLKTPGYPGYWEGIVDVADPAAWNFTWTFLTKTATVADLIPSPGPTHVLVSLKPQGKSATWRLTRSNACGLYQTTHSFWSNKPCPIVIDRVAGPGGSKEVEEVADIVLSPNPARDQLTIATNSGSIRFRPASEKGITEVRLYDAVGRLVKWQRFSNVPVANMQVGDLIGGLYFAEIVSGDQRTRKNLYIKR